MPRLLTSSAISRLVIPIVIPVLAAAAIYGMALSAHPAPPIVGDPVVYHMTAQRLLTQGRYFHAAGDPDAEARSDAGVTPGYAIFLSGMYLAEGARSTDHTATALAVQPKVMGAQFLLAMLTVGLIAGAGLLLGRTPLALLAGVMAALYLPFGWSTTVALGESLANFLAALLLLLSLLMADSKSSRRWPLMIAFGLVGASLTMVRPAAILWLPFPLLYVAVRRLESPRRLLTIAGIAVAGALLVLAPWWIRNAIVLDRFVPLSENSGRVQFFSTGATELTSIEQAKYNEAISAGKNGWSTVANHRIRTQLQSDPSGLITQRLSMFRNALRYPWCAPGEVYWALKNTPNVIALTAGALPTSAPDVLYALMKVTTAYHLVLLLLAALSLLLIRRAPQLGLVASFPLYVLAVHSWTLFISRYFIPAMPAVIILAAAVVYWAGHKVWTLRADKAIG